MRAQLLAVAFFFVPLVSPAETLRDLLTKNHLPSAAFSLRELDQTVQGEVAIHGGRTYLAYNEVKGELLVNPLHLVRFPQGDHPVLRRDMVTKPEENCDGSVLGISFLHRLTVLAMHINPSATCLLILDGRFRIKRKFYGVEWDEVAPYRLAIIENNIHFAPVHPERLLIADLLHPGSTEVYPPKDDALRRQFIGEHAKYIPSEDVCAESNDPCSPDAFDEDIVKLTTEGKGRFAFLANLNAIHASGKDEAPESVLSQTNLYIYQRDRKGWLYCEHEIGDSKVEAARAEMRLQMSPATAGCTPNLPVTPDRTTANYSPFAVN